MINANELKKNYWVLKENPNRENELELCKIFQINEKENYVSLERMNKYIKNGEIQEFPKLDEDHRYVFPVNPVDCHLIFPIPLYESILLNNQDKIICNNNCFVDAGELPPFSSYSVGNITLTKNNNAWEAKYNKGNILSISYLHQLQNLYFELTNKELEVKL